LSSVVSINANKIDNNINNKKDNNNKTNNKPKPMIIFDEDSNNVPLTAVAPAPKKQELVPVTVFKPRVLTNKPIKRENIIEKAEIEVPQKLNYGEITLPPKKQKRTVKMPLKKPSLLKIEEEGEVVQKY
jgi:hypothetical protein